MGWYQRRVHGGCSNSWLVRTQNSRSLHKSIMKCLLVFAVALAAAHADHHEMKAAEMGHIQKVEAVKPVLTYAHAQPLAYTYPVAHPYHTPVVYNHVAPKVQEVTQYVKQPDVTKYVAKPYDVEVKSFQPELQKTGCKNFLGFEVPCKTKREAEHHVIPTVYQVPQVYTHVPHVYNTHQVVAHPTVYKHVAVQQPTVYKYNTKVLPGKVHEVEVPTPQLKHVVEKVPVKPLCTNNFGAPVPCVHNE